MNSGYIKFLGFLFLVLVILILGFLVTKDFFSFDRQNDTSPATDIISIGDESEFSDPDPFQSSIPRPNVEVLMTGLNIPWDVAFLPGGGMLITERVGNLIYRDSSGEVNSISIPRVVHRGEGGLLGVAFHPAFSNNNFIYLYMTTSSSDQGTMNAVVRYRLVDGILTDEEFIVQDIPGALYHDGGRIEFGPDGFLYITTGDAQNPGLAQDTESLAGKILRVHDDGRVPSDNPFGNEVYSYGHRNSQGLAWDSRGQLWSTEHGRTTATLTGMDEINLIKRGVNYGWPDIEGDERLSGMELPARHSGPDVTWAPASAAYYDGSIFFGGLRGASIYEAVLTPANTISAVRRYFYQDFGRIRTIRLGPDGYFYITTSNRDNRGTAGPEDDRLIRINPTVFR